MSIPRKKDTTPDLRFKGARQIADFEQQVAENVKQAWRSGKPYEATDEEVSHFSAQFPHLSWLWAPK